MFTYTISQLMNKYVLIEVEKNVFLIPLSQTSHLLLCFAWTDGAARIFPCSSLFSLPCDGYAAYVSQTSIGRERENARWGTQEERKHKIVFGLVRGSNPGRLRDRREAEKNVKPRILTRPIIMA